MEGIGKRKEEQVGKGKNMWGGKEAWENLLFVYVREHTKS